MNVVLATTPGRACPRCGGEVLATLRHGARDVFLCERCDRDDPVTGPVVTFFTVHERVTEETADQLAVLLRRWADSAGR